MKYLISCLFRSRGKWGFISTLKRDAKILDVGCGCATVVGTKNILPNSTYYGIDIGDYGQNEYSKSLIDNYVITTPENFSEGILKIKEEFDAVISSHNLEHCNDRDKVLYSMMQKVRKGGKLFISFPTSKSIEFPNRAGLNYYDDETHKFLPPNSDYIINELQKNDFKIIFHIKRYRPSIFFLIGLLLEPFSVIAKKPLKGTWELYGFETIIHAKKFENE